MCFLSWINIAYAAICEVSCSNKMEKHQLPLKQSFTQTHSHPLSPSLLQFFLYFNMLHGVVNISLTWKKSSRNYIWPHWHRHRANTLGLHIKVNSFRTWTWKNLIHPLKYRAVSAQILKVAWVRNLRTMGVNLAPFNYKYSNISFLIACALPCTWITVS